MHVRDQQDNDRGRPRRMSVFMSYARSDSQFARYLVDKLTERRIKVYQDIDLPFDESISIAIKKAIDQSDAVIALVSPDYFSSSWTQIEIAIAMSSEKRLIPILVRPSSTEGPLQYFQHLDATQQPELAAELAVRAVEEVR